MDIHILAQGIIYFCMFIAGMVVSITTGVNRVRNIILYTCFTLIYFRSL